MHSVMSTSRNAPKDRTARSVSDTFVQTVPRHRQQGGRHRGANPSPAHAQPHLGGKCALVGAGVRRLAFDRTLPPSEALGRIRDTFHEYDHEVVADNS